MLSINTLKLFHSAGVPLSIQQEIIPNANDHFLPRESNMQSY